ncbi:hypothetical protein BCR44DRAFT_164609 [Catenaria anguillulae PL171]|uniref:Uncharacterized protein n=1 Tax=Catenaria anguillulae PL171 TaxID=765915 RepID=A0A1Y2HJB0_9FUNG|nr:hypothetical protein BCR44DRAFT_164609 [Catenaria anguillulae PL171]
MSAGSQLVLPIPLGRKVLCWPTCCRPTRSIINIKAAKGKKDDNAVNLTVTSAVPAHYPMAVIFCLSINPVKKAFTAIAPEEDVAVILSSYLEEQLQVRHLALWSMCRVFKLTFVCLHSLSTASLAHRRLICYCAQLRREETAMARVCSPILGWS